MPRSCQNRRQTIAPGAEGISSRRSAGEELLRLLQANFDSALDARYAVARGILWAVYIHPLSALTDREFLPGLGQTVNIVRTYGRVGPCGQCERAGTVASLRLQSYGRKAMRN